MSNRVKVKITTCSLYMANWALKGFKKTWPSLTGSPIGLPTGPPIGQLADQSQTSITHLS